VTLGWVSIGCILRWEGVGPMNEACDS
jgi:hypothetical protein